MESLTTKQKEQKLTDLLLMKPNNDGEKIFTSFGSSKPEDPQEGDLFCDVMTRQFSRFCGSDGWVQVNK